MKTPVVGHASVGVAAGRIATLRFSAMNPAWSPDGKQIALIESDGQSRAGNLWIANVNGSVKKLTSGASDGCPAWTVDGRLVVAHAAGNKWTLLVVNPSTGATRPLVSGRTFPQAGRQKLPSAITFSPDGAKVAFDVCKDGEDMDESGRIQVMDLRTSQVADLIVAPKSCVSHPSWSPDGRYLAYQRLGKDWYYNRGGDDSYAQVWVTDLRTNTPRQISVPEKEINFVYPTWCPTGGMLAVEKWLVSMKRESRREAWLVNAANSQSGALLQDEGRGAGGVQWAPDGRHYAYITSLAVNGHFVNELWTGVVTPKQRAAALAAPPMNATQASLMTDVKKGTK